MVRIIASLHFIYPTCTQSTFVAIRRSVIMYAKKINIHCVIFTFSQFTWRTWKIAHFDSTQTTIIIIHIFRMYEKYFGIKIILLFASDRSIHTMCMWVAKIKLRNCSHSRSRTLRCGVAFCSHNIIMTFRILFECAAFDGHCATYKIDSQWNNNDAQLMASSSFIIVRTIVFIWWCNQNLTPVSIWLGVRVFIYSSNRHGRKCQNGIGVAGAKRNGNIKFSAGPKHILFASFYSGSTLQNSYICIYKFLSPAIFAWCMQAYLHTYSHTRFESTKQISRSFGMWDRWFLCFIFIFCLLPHCDGKRYKPNDVCACIQRPIHRINTNTHARARHRRRCHLSIC